MAEQDEDYFQLLKKFGILDDTKLSNYKKRRGLLLNNLKSDERTMSDYGEYIIFEKKLLHLVIQAQKKYRQRISGVKSSVIMCITKSYREALRCFGNQFLLWLAFLKFCKDNTPKDVAAAYEDMLKSHCKEQVWSDYASWVYEYKNDINAADRIISRAFSLFPNSEIFHSTKFRLLLAHMVRLPSNEKAAGFKDVIKCYIKCKEKCQSFKLLLELLEICEDNLYSVLTVGLQKKIIDDLKEMFPRKEEVYDFLAQRELRGYCESDLDSLLLHQSLGREKILPDDSNKDIHTPDEELLKLQYGNDFSMLFKDKIWKQRPLQSRMDLCCKAYELYVRKLNTPKMLSMYIKAMQKLCKNEESQEHNWRCLVLAFRTGHKMRIMSFEDYCVLIKLILNNDELRKSGIAEEIFNEIPENLPNIEKIFHEWFSYYLATNQKDEQIYEVLCIATRKLSFSKALPLWDFVILYFQTRYKNDNRRMQTIYREACRVECVQYVKFRIQFLDWCSYHVSIEQTRKEYDSMVNLLPSSLELHRRMAEIEGNQLQPNIDRWRTCHENAVSFFGRNDREVWNDYIKFETDCGDSNRVAVLYNEMTRAIPH